MPAGVGFEDCSHRVVVTEQNRSEMSLTRIFRKALDAGRVIADTDKFNLSGMILLHSMVPEIDICLEFCPMDDKKRQSLEP